MVTRYDILNFARMGNPFSAGSLANYFESADIGVNRRSLSTQLGRMVKSDELKKASKGQYVISDNLKSIFRSLYDEEMKGIAKSIRESYPFLDICIWSIEDIKALSHYASNRNILYVEVNPDAVEGVFSLLTESFSTRRVFVNPTENDYYHYINGTPAIVVKSLRTEAPCSVDGDGILHPSIEKIMVDVVSDGDFTPWQDYETVRLFETIFSLYAVSTAKLMRYARRRAKSEKIHKLITEINS